MAQGSGDTISAQNTAKVLGQVDARGANAPAGTQAPVGAASAVAITSIEYKHFRIRHEDYDAAYWDELEALYSGGKALLGNDRLMGELFPRHRDEQSDVYEERKRRAFYVPYAGEIVDHIQAELFAQPLHMDVGKNEESDWPPFYDAFFDDCGPKDGDPTPFSFFLRRQMHNALICRTAWALVDFPTRPDVEFDSRLSEEAAGLANAYVVAIDPKSVIDWEVDDDGQLLWAIVMTENSRRLGLGDSRDRTTKRFMYYDRAGWQQWQIEHQAGKEPKDNDRVALVLDGQHSFGRVPLLRMTLPDGLWAMNKLHSIAREHLNKRSALSWAEFQSLFQELYEFLGPEMGTTAMVGENQEDASRALTQSRGQGFVQVRGKDDRAEFIGPEEGPFEHAAASCKELRDEMHRVTHRMALTVDNSAAAMKRSGESKDQDRTSMRLILSALGTIVRHHAVAILRAISIGRGEESLGQEWRAEGMEQFDAVSLPDEISQSLDLQTIEIPSPTFRKLWLMDLVKAKLGDKASPEDYDAIEKELETSVTAEAMDPTPPAMDRVPTERMEDEGGEEDDDKGGEPDRRVMSKSKGMK